MIKINILLFLVALSQAKDVIIDVSVNLKNGVPPSKWKQQYWIEQSISSYVTDHSDIIYGSIFMNGSLNETHYVGSMLVVYAPGKKLFDLKKEITMMFKRLRSHITDDIRLHHKNGTRIDLAFAADYLSSHDPVSIRNELCALYRSSYQGSLNITDCFLYVDKDRHNNISLYLYHHNIGLTETVVIPNRFKHSNFEEKIIQNEGNLMLSGKLDIPKNMTKNTASIGALYHAKIALKSYLEYGSNLTLVDKEKKKSTLELVFNIEWNLDSPMNIENIVDTLNKYAEVEHDMFPVSIINYRKFSK